MMIPDRCPFVWFETLFRKLTGEKIRSITMKLAWGTIREVIIREANGARLIGTERPNQVKVLEAVICERIVIHPKTTLSSFVRKIQRINSCFVYLPRIA